MEELKNDMQHEIYVIKEKYDELKICEIEKIRSKYLKDGSL